MYALESLKIRRRSWFKVANIPAKSVGWTLSDCLPLGNATDYVKHWLEHVKSDRVIRAYGSSFCGKGVMLYGDAGHGKSTLASAVLQEMITTFSLATFKSEAVLVRPCYFTSYTKLIALKGRTMEPDTSDWDYKLYYGILGECADDAYNVRVLVIDDVGHEHMGQNGWSKNLLHEVLRTRFENGLPTIMTTNLSTEDWVNGYGDATRNFLFEAFLSIAVENTAGHLR